MLIRTVSLYRTSFTGLSAQTWLLAFIMLINRSGTMVVPFMTLYLTSEEMGHTLSDAGTVMGLFGLGVIAGAYIGGLLSDKIGFFRVQLLTLFFGGVLFMILGQIKSFPLICIFTFLLSFVNEAFRPANSTAVAFYSKPQNRTRSYSLNRLAINLGWAIGSSAGGLIASVNYELLFWIDGITNISAAALLFTFLRPAKQVLFTKQEVSSQPAKRSAYRDVSFLLFVLYTIIFAMGFFQLFTTVPKYFRDNLMLSEGYIGYLMALNGLIIVGFEMILVYVLEKRNQLMVYISSGVAICAVSYLSLLLPIPAQLVTLLMILLITAGEILCMPFMNTYWIERSDARSRGQYAALYTMAWGIGQTVGPFACSRIADNYGFNFMFTVLAASLFVASAGFLFLPPPTHGRT